MQVPKEMDPLRAFFIFLIQPFPYEKATALACKR